MPTYLDMIKNTDWGALKDAAHLDMLRAGGIVMVLSSIVMVMSVLWYLIAVVTWTRKRLGQAVLLGIVGAGLGWAASYVGYSEAEKIVQASGATPTPEEIADGGKHVSYAAFIPTLAFVAVTSLCALSSLVIRSRRRDDDEE